MKRARTKLLGAGRPSEEERDFRRMQLIDAARKELLRTGGTEFRLNQVLKAAGGSKTTLYTYFGSRDGLLDAVLRQAVEEAFAQPEAEAAGSEDVEDILLSVARGAYQVVLSRDAIALFRMAITEAKTSPALARHFFDTGPAAARRVLIGILEEWTRKALLKVDDPVLAADIFFGMLLEGPVLSRILMLQSRGENLEARAKETVARFLRAYRR